MLSIILMGLFDRMRGGGWFGYSHASGMLGMGLVTAWMLGAHGWLAAYVVVAVMLGAAPGWGNPLGAAFEGRPMEGKNYEWWQVGYLRRSTLAAVAFRGAMWGLPLTPVSWSASLAFTLAFTIAPYLIRWTVPPHLKIDRWGVMEFTRGAAIAALLLLMV